MPALTDPDTLVFALALASATARRSGSGPRIYALRTDESSMEHLSS